MCAIAGIWDSRAASVEAEARTMIAPVLHRGPDGTGFAHGEGWALSHARLAIIDLTGGDQPLKANDVALVGNNEIYNAPELRSELEKLGRVFKTQSDTEVILQGYLAWGADVFSRLNGMFAVAIADGRQLILARDPMGIKPLHLASYRGGYVFASEIKSILALPHFTPEPNWDAVHLFMNFRYVPDERTLFNGVSRVAPGTFVRIGDGGVTEHRFYDPPRPGSKPLSYEDAVGQLEETLERAVQRHLLSDVEVAGYLSGGLDSSILTSLAAPHLKEMRTFCLGFDEPTDENADAALVARHVGTRHEDFTMKVGALDRLNEIIWHVEEPKVNCLQGYLLAEKVSSRVKVALSGLGGDELFAGYVNNDILYPMSRVNGVMKWLPLPSGEWVHGLFGSGADHFFRMGDLFSQLGDPLGFYCTLRNVFDHSPTLMGRMYTKAPSHWHGMSREALRPYFDEKEEVMGALLVLESRTKMVNDFLLTEDRVSMANGLEVRVPLLDRELVDLVVPLPTRFKYRPGEKKRILRRVARRHLPASVFQKPKWGFSVNPYHLFQKELRDFAQRELTRERVGELGLFSYDWIREVLHASPSPRRRWHYFNLWALCGFSLWHRQFIEGAGRGENKKAETG